MPRGEAAQRRPDDSEYFDIADIDMVPAAKNGHLSLLPGVELNLDEETPELDDANTIGLDEVEAHGEQSDEEPVLEAAADTRTARETVENEHQDTDTREPAQTAPGKREKAGETYVADQFANLDGLQVFISQVRNSGPLLTKTEEVELAKRIERGDLAAKDRLITSNLRLVMSEAKRYRNNGLPYRDLIQEGAIGLVRASEKFDWRKGYKFSTYATLWIRQAMTRGIQDKSRTIRVPVHVHEQQRKVQNTAKQLLTELGREPTVEELAEASELDAGHVDRAIKAKSMQPISIDKPIGDDEGGSTLGDVLANSHSTSDEASENAAHDEQLRALKNAMATSGLTVNEHSTLELRFGFVDDDPLTLDEVGKRLNLTRERIRQLESSGLKKLSGNRKLARATGREIDPLCAEMYFDEQGLPRERALQRRTAVQNLKLRGIIV